jgi:hypothetical protein
MLRLPSRFAAVILRFVPLLCQRSWRHAEVLLIGAILASGMRTVTSLLRICGLIHERRFVNYHRVLNRAAWSPRLASPRLLDLLINTFVPDGPVVLGIDDTIERRRGTRIATKGIHRDLVRSSHGHFAKASGLRWLSLMLLVPISWAGRARPWPGWPRTGRGTAAWRLCSAPAAPGRTHRRCSAARRRTGASRFSSGRTSRASAGRG